MAGERLRVNLRDVGFAHHTTSKYATLYGDSNLFEWDRTCSQPGPTVHTDGFLNDDVSQYPGDKVAWLTEPVVIAPGMYDWIRANHHLFVEVWSHNEDVLRFCENVGRPCVFVHGACSFVEPASQRVGSNSKLCSFIASSKNWAPGHRLRQEVRGQLPGWVDSFGHGFAPLENKSDGLRDYAFSIAIENSVQDTYFTEKLVDCFSTGTVPIYWGTRAIEKYFNTDGVIHFDRVDELPGILQSLSVDDYLRRMPAIVGNFEHAKGFHVPEEWGVRGSRFFGFKEPRTVLGAK
jgi:hypothetical protein